MGWRRKLDELIQWYMRQYDYTRGEAIKSILADMRDLRKGTIQ